MKVQYESWIHNYFATSNIYNFKDNDAIEDNFFQFHSKNLQLDKH